MLDVGGTQIKLLTVCTSSRLQTVQICTLRVALLNCTMAYKGLSKCCSKQCSSCKTNSLRQYIQQPDGVEQRILVK